MLRSSPSPAGRRPARELSLDILRQLLSDLNESDRFAVLASDITTRTVSGASRSLRPPGRAAIEETLNALRAIEPEGASALSLAFSTAGAAAKGAGPGAQIVYIGDGVPTWGETDPQKLSVSVRESLGETPLFAAVLGRGPDEILLQRLTASLGGKSAHIRRRAQAKKFAQVVSTSNGQPHITDVRVSAPAAHSVFPAEPTTVFSGDELVALVRTRSGEEPPKTLLVTGKIAGADFTREVPVPATTEDTPYVAHRWTSRELQRLTRESAPKDEIVKLSLEHGVMSKHTAFLVLESEEAYARFQIERKQREQAATTPRVSGADLESINGPLARLSPNRIQPGDPEIRIPAPADAQAVVVVFPFGESKTARYEAALGAWTVRFLIAENTPDGRYEVRITHSDGSVETLKLHYDVDTTAPHARVRIRRHPSLAGVFVVAASQRITDVEMRHAIGAVPSGESRRDFISRHAHIVHDLQRVEVAMPDGQVVELHATPSGDFYGRWKPTAPVGKRVSVRLVATDNAQNSKTAEQRVEIR